MLKIYVLLLKKNIKLLLNPEKKKLNYSTPSKKELKLDSLKCLQEFKKEVNKTNSQTIIKKKNSNLLKKNEERFD